MSHDPKFDPQPGDVMTKATAKRILVRKVIKVEANHVTYESVGKTFTCWISTWNEWCRDARVEKLPSSATEKLWDVVIYEIETRKIASVAGKDLRESGGFHTVGKRLDTVLGRLNNRYDAMDVPAGQFKEGDVLPELMVGSL